MKLFPGLTPTVSKYKIQLAIFLTGLLLLVVSVKLRTGCFYEISPRISLLCYASYFLSALGLYLICIKGGKIILSNLLLIFLLLLCTEITCYFLLKMPVRYNTNFSVPEHSPEDISTQIGTLPHCDSVYHIIKINGTDTAFNVRETIDHSFKRVTPDHNPAKNKYALFFGCSITYGEGLDDNQTLPYFFQQDSSGCNSYNFAYKGQGTNQMLARFQYQDLSKQVNEKNGYAFYIFFWDHINRSVGSMNTYLGWLLDAPYYCFDHRHELRRKGNFSSGRPVLSAIYKFIYDLSIVEYFHLNFPLRLKARDFDLVSEMIRKSSENYSKQFGNDNFYVVLYPLYNFCSGEQYNEFKSWLDRKKIKYIDLTGMTFTGNYNLKGDPHPNANTNRIIADELLKHIRK